MFLFFFLGPKNVERDRPRPGKYGALSRHLAPGTGPYTRHNRITAL